MLTMMKNQGLCLRLKAWRIQVVLLFTAFAYLLLPSCTDPCPHNYVLMNDTATCTIGGMMEYECTICGSQRTEGSLPKGHSPYVVDEQLPTCVSEGGIHYACYQCPETWTEPHPEAEQLSGEHDFLIALDQAPTCTDPGVFVTICRLCSLREESRPEALGHNLDLLLETDATCTEKGSILYGCNRCAYTESQEIPELGHDYQLETSQAATCTEAGSDRFVCTRCGDSFSLETAEALGHDYGLIHSVPATCTETGSDEYKCSRCPDGYTETLDALGHKYETLVDYAATCTTAGLRIQYCNQCQGKIQEDFEALGHDFQLELRIQASCMAEGKDIYDCSRCEEKSETVIPKLDHDYQEVENIQPTCQKDGKVVYRCEREGCIAGYEEALPMLPHTPGEAATIYAPQVCTACQVVLEPALEYDLAINHYYGFTNDCHSVTVSTQSQAEYDLDEQTYFSSPAHTNPIVFQDGLPLQDFYTHELLTAKKATTADGKRFTVDAGFKVAFRYNMTDKDILGSDIATKSDFLSWFRDPSLLRVVQRKKADNAYYSINKIIDFADSYIEVAKQVEGRYVTIGLIDADDWASVLPMDEIILSDQNGALFSEAGNYRIMFKFSVAWFLESASGAIYDGEGQPCYPYGFINDQYDYFYVTVTDETQNVLLPDDVDETTDLFYQLNLANTKDTVPFVRSGERIHAGDRLTLVVDSKIRHKGEGAAYRNRYLTDWSLSIGQYHAESDSYVTSYSYDLLAFVGDTASAVIDLPKNYAVTGDCKLTVSYTFMDPVTQTETTKTDAYYLYIE